MVVSRVSKTPPPRLSQEETRKALGSCLAAIDRNVGTYLIKKPWAYYPKIVGFI